MHSLSHAILKTALLVAASLAVSGGVGFASSGTKGNPVSILVADDQKRVMVECELSFSPGWTSYGVGDPLGLKLDAPVSMDYQPAENSLCEQVDPAAAAAMCSFQVMLRNPEAQTKCPTPMEPTGLFLWKKLPDGGVVILRVPEDKHPASLQVGYAGQTYEMEPVDALDVCRLELKGDDSDTKLSELEPEDIVARVDAQSHLAYKTHTGRQDALLSAAEAMSLLLEKYKEKRDNYPRTMCQLYTGPTAIVSSIPRNPWIFEMNLCATEHSALRPRGALRYYPQEIQVSESERMTVGYWLAVLGEGPVVPPALALPPQVAAPLRAVSWIERHPKDD
jgi:hypothetical protein